ncbi:hypothetical protein BJV78DRAFT_615888 [Lactifluus subvellereus]|nr:hypothetical protein BJV78DRAFT_615888 [Lactifluus subvellereus]
MPLSSSFLGLDFLGIGHPHSSAGLFNSPFTRLSSHSPSDRRSDPPAVSPSVACATGSDASLLARPTSISSIARSAAVSSSITPRLVLQKIHSCMSPQRTQSDALPAKGTSNIFCMTRGCSTVCMPISPGAPSFVYRDFNQPNRTCRVYIA